MREYAVILFHTTSAAFRTEKALKESGLECKLIPTPRELSSDCGIAARIERDRLQEAVRVLETKSVETAGIR